MLYATHEFASIKLILVICVSLILLLAGCSNSDADYEKALEESAAEKVPIKQEAQQGKEFPTENLPVIENNIAEKSKQIESEATDIAIEIIPDKQEYVIGDKPLLK